MNRILDKPDIHLNYIMLKGYRAFLLQWMVDDTGFEPVTLSV